MNKTVRRLSTDTERLEVLCKAFLRLKNTAECRAFLRDLCTLSEIKAMSERLAVAQLVLRNVSYRDISKKIGVSTTTVSRAAHWLHHGMGGYQHVLRRK